MTLTLRVTGSPEAGGTSEVRTLTDGAIVLGRAPGCDIVLVDPERTLSNRHCRIAREADGWTITDTSTNGVFFDGQQEPLGRGNTASLVTGSVVHLGFYQLDFTVVAAAAAQPAHDPAATQPAPEFLSPFQAPRETAAPAPVSSSFGHQPGPIASQPEDVWLETLETGHYGPGMLPARQGWDAPPDPAQFAGSGILPDFGSDPLAGIPDSAFSAGAEHVPATATTMPLPTSARLLPLDWDQPDAMPAGPPVEPSPVADAAILPPLDRAPTAIDSILAAPAPVVREPVAEIVPAALVGNDAVYEAPPVEADASRQKPDAPPRPAAPLAGYVSPRERAEEAGDAAAAIRPPVPEPAAPTPSPAVPVAAPAAGTTEALLAAFLHGAGITPDAVGHNDPETVMRNAGAIVRIAVEGLREILTTRAMMKVELRVEHTILRPGDNNTLKFVPDLQSCLMALLGDPPPGFMRGPACVQQSLDDVKRHEIAMVAAWSGAMGDMLAQMDPERIRAEGDEDVGIGTMFPAAKKARYWQIFERLYRELKDRQGDGSGASLIGPMASAYARQITRVS